jgi:hypothetical protein
MHRGAEGALTPAGSAGEHSPHEWGKAFANPDSWNPLLRPSFPIVSARVRGLLAGGAGGAQPPQQGGTGARSPLE